MRRTHLEARLGFFAPLFAPLLSRLRYGFRRFEFGMELIMDLRVPDHDVIADGDRLQDYVEELVKVIDMKPYGPTWIEHFGHNSEVTNGYTVIQPIETSSITLHLSEGKLTAHINIFSCKRFSPQEAMEFTERFFVAQQNTYTVLER
jgi:S-adenosylmethionine/arginine decarboxylase-like enzyme